VSLGTYVEYLNPVKFAPRISSRTFSGGSLDQITKNFSRSEFSCHCGCGKAEISGHLVRKLQEVRDIYGKAMQISSGFRCVEHNAIIGGRLNSAHLSGLAADITIVSSAHRFDILPIILAKFERVGVGSDFIHCDIDSEKPQEIIWTY